MISFYFFLVFKRSLVFSEVHGEFQPQSSLLSDTCFGLLAGISKCQRSPFIAVLFWRKCFLHISISWHMTLWRCSRNLDVPRIFNKKKTFSAVLTIALSFIGENWLSANFRENSEEIVRTRRPAFHHTSPLIVHSIAKTFGGTFLVINWPLFDECCCNWHTAVNGSRSILPLHYSKCK